MTSSITVANVQAALDEFTRAGLIIAMLPAETPRRKRRFGKRQKKLIKTVIGELRPRFAPGGKVVYIGDAEDKFLHLDADYLQRLDVLIPAPAKMPDIVMHDMRRNWLFLIEAVASSGPVDGKRRKELKDLFAGCKAGLVFVTAFETRRTMQSFIGQIAWESEVWIAEDPDHMIHFNGERFLGPYPDVTPK